MRLLWSLPGMIYRVVLGNVSAEKGGDYEPNFISEEMLLPLIQ